jgi:hypothetical protein
VREEKRMKIDGQPAAELLQQIQELHRQSVDQTTTDSAPGFSVDTASPASSTAPASASTPLQDRIEVEASRALNGEFSTDAEVRSAVIDVIIDEKFGDRLSVADRRKMTRTLKENLVDDPGFVRQVDDMLLLAARELARRG